VDKVVQTKKKSEVKMDKVVQRRKKKDKVEKKSGQSCPETKKSGQSCPKPKNRQKQNKGEGDKIIIYLIDKCKI
jgi:hypothetical protein